MCEDIALIPKPSNKEKLDVWVPILILALFPRLGLLWGVASHLECKNRGVYSVLCAVCRHIESLPLVSKKRCFSQFLNYTFAFPK